MALVLVFISGFAGLVYQVLWMKQLGLLFGNTSHAAAVTLAVFFAGLAAGSWLWGRRSAQMTRPLRAYGWLELAIAGSAGLYFVILRLYHAIYPALYEQFASTPVMGAVRVLGALLLIFPPALFMGGTIPVMGQYLIGYRGGGRARFGETAAMLYALNTLGAALGAFFAGFYLPMWLGFRLTCIAAMALTVVAAGLAFALSRRAQPTTPAEESQTEPAETVAWQTRLPLSALCFLSGFGFLALEVLWTRLFMQVLENSVYTYATILVIVLIGLSIGALIAGGLAKVSRHPLPVLAGLVVAGGVSVALTPFIFMEVTNSFEILATRGSWSNYVGMVFVNGLAAIGLPAVVLGAIFPFLMKTEERYVRAAGQSLGRLAAINTVGAILGALVCGFVFLGLLKSWGTMQLLAGAYLLAAMFLPIGWGQRGIAIRGSGAIALLLLATWWNPTGLPVTSTDPHRQEEDRTLQVWEATDNTVAVTRGPYGLMIRMNSHYGLGTTGSALQERLQNDLPMTVYPDTSSIFFLGMGTGITAGAAVDEQFKDRINRIVVCELSPQVIEAAKLYFTDVDGVDFTNGLFDDRRVTILPEDGRYYMMATTQRFDMVNGDLFVPYRRGVGSLYTREHFQNVRDRLAPDGVFFQWLPLYQVTEYEFSVVVRTMLEVFDNVTLWRGSFRPFDDIIAIAGHNGDAPLPATDVNNRAEMRAAVEGATVYDVMNLALPFDAQAALLFYCGNLRQAEALFADYPVNTDDKPVIEYQAPRSFRKASDGENPWFIGPRIASLVERVQQLSPPTSDPMLANRPAADRLLPVAGRHLYGARLSLMMGQPDQTFIAWQRFLEAWSGRTPTD